MNDKVIEYLLKRKDRLEFEVKAYKDTQAKETYKYKLSELNEVNGLLQSLNVITFDMLVEK